MVVNFLVYVKNLGLEFPQLVLDIVDATEVQFLFLVPGRSRHHPLLMLRHYRFFLGVVNAVLGNRNFPIDLGVLDDLLEPLAVLHKFIMQLTRLPTFCAARPLIPLLSIEPD